MVMQEFPSAVSFKELSSLLESVRQVTPAEDTSAMESVSLDWADRVQALLNDFEQSSSIAAEGKTPQQVMALGSLRTHLMLGLQALKAADI